jgi:hypothetical protein
MGSKRLFVTGIRPRWLLTNLERRLCGQSFRSHNRVPAGLPVLILTLLLFGIDLTLAGSLSLAVSPPKMLVGIQFV